MTGRAFERVRNEINRFGPISFSDYMEIALYDEEVGFYSVSGEAGRKGDFVTSPEIGPLFGAVISSALDRWWDELGKPDPFIVVEAGAGRGTLAASVLSSGSACSSALRYVLVERSARLRELQSKQLTLEPASMVLGPAVVPVGDYDEPEPEVVRNMGPLVTSLAELPARPFQGIVLANELLDNLTFDLFVFDGAWQEVRVGLDDQNLVEVLVPATEEARSQLSELIRDPRNGCRVPLQHRAQEWLRQALHLVSGRLVVVDYADETGSMAKRPWKDWIRTYRHQSRGGHPLDFPGDQDITCEVAVDQLSQIRPPVSRMSQSDFLRQHGIENLVEEARAQWHSKSHIGDLDALKSRTRISEGEALLDPNGLGGFQVLEWVTD